MLLAIADNLVRRSVWILGGDGWAYDIGYGGLDHVLASGRDVNVLVLDTEVYSNTGGQMLQVHAARRGGEVRRGRQAAAQEGPGPDRHDLRQRSTWPAWRWAPRTSTRSRRSSRPNPIRARRSSSPTAIASPTASTWTAASAPSSRSLAVDSGQWLLYRYDPRRADKGENPLQLDSAAAKTKVQDYLLSENRFKMLTKSKPEDAKKFFAQAQTDADRRWAYYQYLAGRNLKSGNGAAAQAKPAATVDQQP